MVKIRSRDQLDKDENAFRNLRILQEYFMKDEQDDWLYSVKEIANKNGISKPQLYQILRGLGVEFRSNQ
jgi:DNA-binding IscR family transcriptional regulator